MSIENPFRDAKAEQAKAEKEAEDGTHFAEDARGALHSGETAEEARRKALDANEGYK